MIELKGAERIDGLFNIKTIIEQNISLYSRCVIEFENDIVIPIQLSYLRDGIIYFSCKKKHLLGKVLAKFDNRTSIEVEITNSTRTLYFICRLLSMETMVLLGYIIIHDKRRNRRLKVDNTVKSSKFHSIVIVKDTGEGFKVIGIEYNLFR